MAEIYTPQNQQETHVFKGRLLPKLPAHYTEPSLVYPLIVPYGAMPANPFRDDAVREQQKFIDGEYAKLYNSPPCYMPRDFIEHVVVEDYETNEVRRKIENFDMFMKFSNSGAEINPEYATMLDRVERGQASIDEILHLLVTPEIDLRKENHAEIEAGEFGKVSTPYGYRLEQLTPFREEMNAAIRAHGGVVYPDITPYRSIKILPRVVRFDDGTKYGGQEIIGFIVKYKRDYGHVPVIGKDNEVVRVVERQITAYRVDPESGFDQNIMNAMHTLRDLYPKRIHWDKQPMDDNAQKVFDHRMKSTGCKDFIETAVQTDSLDAIVVPISTTMYGFRDELPEKPQIDLVARAALESVLHSKLNLLPSSY